MKNNVDSTNQNNNGQMPNASEFYYPIPPNRECIESADMALHIPIAVDYFYEYLIHRQQS